MEAQASLPPSAALRWLRRCLWRRSPRRWADGFVRPPLRSGFEAAKRRRPPGTCRKAAVEVRWQYDAAQRNRDADGLRVHMATILEYARRVRSVAEVLSSSGGSSLPSLAIARAALESVTKEGGSGRRYRYRTYGLRRKSGLHKLAGLLVWCVDFTEHVALDVDTNKATELVFIDAAKDSDKLLSDLDFYGACARNFLLVHNTEASTVQAATKAWLGGPVSGGSWEVLEHSVAGSGLTVLRRRSLQKADVASDKNMTRACDANELADALAEARALAPTLLAYSPHFPGMFGGALKVNVGIVYEMRIRIRRALYVCPSDPEAQSAMRLIMRHFSGRHLKSEDAFEAPVTTQASSLENLFSVDANEFFLAASKAEAGSSLVALYSEAVLRWPSRFEGWIGLASLLTQHEHVRKRWRTNARCRQRRDLAAHAWRRALALHGRSRSIAGQAVQGLVHLRKDEEAGVAWAELASGAAGGFGALWDDPRRSLLATTWRPSVTERAGPFPEVPELDFLREYPEFAFAKTILSDRWKDIREELLHVVATEGSSKVNGFCKGNGWCEYMFFSYEHCRLLSECALAPELCEAVKAMEAAGLRVARASVSVVGSWETKESSVHIQPHGSSWPGRLRLSCTILSSEGATSTMWIEGEKPRVYEEGKCFWFDESFTHEVTYTAPGKERFRATLYIDALHPGYLRKAHDVEVGMEPGSLLAWQAALASTPGSFPAPAQVFRVTAPGPRPWMVISQRLQREKVDTCTLGDNGALFHLIAFQSLGLEPEQRFEAVTCLLGIFRHVEGLLLNYNHLSDRTQGAAAVWRANLHRLSAGDVLHLASNILPCLAHGCERCPSLEISGLCIRGLDRELLESVFLSFARHLYVTPGLLKRWFAFLGLEMPPPLGWGVTLEHIQAAQERDPEGYQLLVLSA